MYVKDLSYEEVKVLKAICSLLKEYEIVQGEQIACRARIHIDRVNFALSRLNEKRLIVKDAYGYRLLYAGLDALALYELAYKGIIAAIGKSIGVGKEADVFECIDANSNRLALKLFRIGRISFRDVARKRAYKHMHSWLLLSVEAARREYHALKRLMEHNVDVPKVITYNKHCIVMEYIEGKRLVECMLDDPKGVFNRIMDNIRLAYHDADLISSDLSEYNIMYDGNKVWIIDWPQSIGKEHANADMLLERDVRNIVNFFRKRYGLEYDIKEILEYLKSNKREENS